MYILSYINYAAIKLIQKERKRESVFLSDKVLRKKETPSEEIKAHKFLPYNCCLSEPKYDEWFIGKSEQNW